MGQVLGGMNNITRASYQQSLMSERLNAQWRAFGTTIRYAFAGSVIFGSAKLVTNLSQIQTQLGQITALAGVPGRTAGSIIPISPKQVDDLSKSVRAASVESITPVNELNDALVNLFSTIEQADPAQAVRMVTEVAKVSKLIQTTPIEAQQAFFQMQFAFHRPHTLNELKKQRDMFFALIKEAPGGVAAAPQIFQQLGPLARVGQFANLRQDQMLALTLASLRGGGTPSTNLRGLQYLIETLGRGGTTKESRQALKSIGLSQENVQRMGGMSALLHLLRHAKSLGVKSTGKMRGLDEETLATLEAEGGGPGDFGLEGGGAEFLTRALKRVHALRTAVGLMMQLERTEAAPSLAEDLRVITAAEEGHADDVHNFSKQWERFRERAKLAQAGTALQALQLQVAQTLEPLFNITAQGLTGLQRAAQRHPDATKGAVIGGASILAALGLSGGLGGISKLFRRGGSGIGMGIAARDAMTQGAAGAGMSPQNPLYVIVVSQLFGGGTSITGGPGPIGGVKTGGGGRFGALGRLAAKGGAGASTAAALGRVGLGTAGLAAMDAMIAAELVMDKEFQEDMKGTWYGRAGAWTWRHRGRGLRHLLGGDKKHDFGPLVPMPMPQGGWSADPVIAALQKRAMMPQEFADKMRMHGEITVNLDITNPDGSQRRKKVHVPVDMWTGGRTPSSRGKQGNTRRSGR